MNFKVENARVYGLNESVIASGNPMRSEMEDKAARPTEKQMTRGSKLGGTGSGEGHDQFLTGIIVQFDIYAPLFMWKEIQRYHFLDFVSSQSTMHRLAKLAGDSVASRCVDDVDPQIVARYDELLAQYNEGTPTDEGRTELWRTLIASLPSGFILGATMTTNYRQLKTIYQQRKNHKLKEWHQFCDWCETLPHFCELTGVKR